MNKRIELRRLLTIPRRTPDQYHHRHELRDGPNAMDIVYAIAALAIFVAVISIEIDVQWSKPAPVTTEHQVTDYRRVG